MAAGPGLDAGGVAAADAGSATADGPAVCDLQPDGGGIMPMGGWAWAGSLMGGGIAAGGVASEAVEAGVASEPVGAGVDAAGSAEGSVTIGEGTAGPGTI